MVKFQLGLKAIDPIILPQYKGSTLRGGFGHAFKKVVCTVRDKACEECLLKTRCVYSYVFETPPPEGSEILRKYQKVPHPFVIEPPPDIKRVYKPGEALTFNLILIGRAADYLPYFIYTFEELGKIGIGRGKGKYALREVACDGKVIYSGENKVLKNGYDPVSISDVLNTMHSNTRTLTVNFLTPTRISFNADLVVDLEFHHLMRSLLRRISTLSYFHYGQRLDLDFKGLIERAGKIEAIKSDIKWYDWERYSARQDTRMKLGGFTGHVTFEGELKEFMSFLKAGEALHVGKGTSFGLGRYGIEVAGE